jgi:hypothetical protein
MDNEKEVAVSIALINAQMSQLVEDMKEARHARKNNYTVQETISNNLIKMEHRLATLEAFMTGATPTLAEFNALKLKAQGAGAFGHFLWVLAGITISSVAWVIAAYQKWFVH